MASIRPLDLELADRRVGLLEALLGLELARHAPDAVLGERVADREEVLGVAGEAADLLPAVRLRVEAREGDVGAAVGEAGVVALRDDLALDLDLAVAHLADLERVLGGHGE